jgi:hypothetical protein
LRVLVMHFLLGFTRLSDVGCYCDEPLTKRVVGLRTVPYVSTVSRTLAGMGAGSVDNLRAHSGSGHGRARQGRFRHVTLDCDGTVLSTRRHSEGTALALETWVPRRQEPHFHISSAKYGWKGHDPKPHANYVKPSDIPDAWQKGGRFTVDVEAKPKEKAVLRLLSEWSFAPTSRG